MKKIPIDSTVKVAVIPDPVPRCLTGPWHGPRSWMHSPSGAANGTVQERCCGKWRSVPIDGGELLERAWPEVAHIVNVVVLE